MYRRVLCARNFKVLLRLDLKVTQKFPLHLVPPRLPTLDTQTRFTAGLHILAL